MTRTTCDISLHKNTTNKHNKVLFKAG